MGCDIHLQVERRGEDGIWHRVPHPDRPCDSTYCDGGILNDETPNEQMRGKPCWHCQGTGRTIEPFYNDRNYDVFGMLANVRNGSGFAGIDTGDGFVPLTDGRGLPDDLSPEISQFLAIERDYEEDYEDKADYRTKVEKILGPGWYLRGKSEDYEGYWDHPQTFYFGDHSFTWMTVAELLAYDWDRTTKKRGWVDPWQFEIFRREGHPHSWSGGVSGQMVEHISNQAMARMIDEGEIVFEGDPENYTSGWDERPYRTKFQDVVGSLGDFPEGSVGSNLATRPTHYVTLVEWEIAYRDSAKRFLEILHRDIVPLGDPEDVRS